MVFVSLTNHQFEQSVLTKRYPFDNLALATTVFLKKSIHDDTGRPVYSLVLIYVESQALIYPNHVITLIKSP